MNYPLASKDDIKNGWNISYDYLKLCQDKIEKITEYHIGLEEIEAVLICTSEMRKRDMNGLTLGDDVAVVNYHERYDGRTGKIVNVDLDLEDEPVYTIRYTDSSAKGMFKQSELKMIDS